MKNFRITTLILLLISCSITVMSQSNTGNENTRKYQYQYSFENASSEEVVKATEISLGKLLHVTEVKCQYKSDSQRGQFTITVIEEEIKSETQELFSPKLIKETFLQHGLKPIEFTVIEEIIK